MKLLLSLILAVFMSSVANVETLSSGVLFKTVEGCEDFLNDIVEAALTLAGFTLVGGSGSWELETSGDSNDNGRGLQETSGDPITGQRHLCNSFIVPFDRAGILVQVLLFLWETSPP